MSSSPPDIVRYRPTAPLDYELLAVVRTGSLPIITEYVEEHNVSVDDLTASLKIAVEACQLDVSRYLLQKGGLIADYIPQSAAKTGSVPMFELFTEYGWKVNDPYSRSRMVLPAAVESEDLTRWLLDQGADPNLGEPTWGDTSQPIVYAEALEAAADICNTKIFDLLIEHGAKGETCIPLHVAASSARPDTERNHMIAHLLQLGFDINGTDVSAGPYSFGPPLHYALRAKNTAAVQFLVENGADLSLKNARGETAEEHAVKLRNSDLIAALQKENQALRTTFTLNQNCIFGP